MSTDITKQQILRDNASLFWDVANLSTVSDLAMVERFLQYGDWKNIRSLEALLGKHELRLMYQTLRSKKRTNHSIFAAQPASAQRGQPTALERTLREESAKTENQRNKNRLALDTIYNLLRAAPESIIAS